MDDTSNSQMDRPSTSTDAIATKPVPEDQGSVSSPDPPSTRPNPFDDSDLLARKRRRTSGSASASASASASPPPPSASTRDNTNENHKTTLNNHVDASNPGANNLDLDQQRQDEVVTTAHVAESLRTPPTSMYCDPNNSTPLSSSKVTINLRNLHDSALGPSEPSSPTSMRQAHDVISDSRRRTTEETGYFDSAQQPQMDIGALSNIGTSSKSSPDSTSPPVELITISDVDSEDSDDEMVFSVDDKAAGIISNDMTSLDPILQFPYSEPDDDPSAPLHRLLEYLSTHSPVDSKIIAQVQAWIEDHLKFAESTEASIVRDSREAYKQFWLALPSVIFQLSTRSPDLCKVPELRSSIVELYAAFASLAARMVALDALVIEDWQDTRGQDSQQSPELFSPRYLQQLYDVLSPDACVANARHEAQPSLGWSRQHDVGSYLIAKLQASTGGSVNHLSQFASLLASLLPQCPRLVDALAPVAQVIAACMREAVFTISSDQSANRTRETDSQLEAGHLVWNHLSDCLDLMIDKHVTRLSAETTTALLNASSEILKCALRGSHQQAADELQAHLHDFPDLPITHSVEAIGWKWSLKVLERLIRSGQMQLRVMAIAKLCGDLVFIWQSAGNASDEDTTLFIEHLSTHLLQTHLVDYIFGPNCHPEIIVESANVLGFLIVTRKYSQQHTDRLWQGLTVRQDSHAAEALARMITSITGLLDYNGLVAWCEKFQTLPLEGFSLSMRTLWESIMENMIKRCQSEPHTPSLHPFRLCLRLLREASVCTKGCQVADAELQFVAMQKLREFLSFGLGPEDRGTLFVSCIDDIAQKTSTSLGSLWCLSMAIRGTVVRDLQVLTEQHDLARLVIEELAHAVGAGRREEAVAALSGDSNMPRRDMITNIIQFQPSAINDELGAKLLDILVGPESPCAEDRAAGWLVILHVMKQASLKNSFLQTCFSRYLPRLPASCFSDGMLEFVRERVLSLARDNGEFALDDSETLSNSGLEQLWRIVLEADDSFLAARAISTLAVDLYLESNTMRRCSVPRARKVHLSLVSRCLSQMHSTATRIKGSGRGGASDGDASLVTVAADRNPQQKELTFRRSLQLLKFFVEKHQAHPRFSVPDLRPFMASAPDEMTGCSAELKYQWFDGNDQSSIKPLQVGRDNTVASLLARIKKETGFENYRIYYRGQQWSPSEDQMSLTLYELHIQDDIMLVKREENSSSTALRVKPGSSQLEIEILSHFKELWEYLGTQEQLAEDIYDFLVRLPADGEFTERFESDTASHLDIFLKGHPFKTLYAIHAIGDYVEAAHYQRQQVHPDAEGASKRVYSFQQALGKSLQLVVDAIADPELLDGVSSALRLRIVESLVQTYMKLFDVATKNTPKIELKSNILLPATRLYEILCLAKEHDDDPSLKLIDGACAAIFRVGSESLDFWNILVSKTKFLELIANLVLKDPRRLVKQTVVELIEDATSGHPITSTVVPAKDTANDEHNPHQMTISLFSAMVKVLPDCMEHQSEPEEYFKLFLYLLEQTQTKSPSAINIESLVESILDLLLKHNSQETIDQPNVIDPVAAGLTSLLHLCLQLDVRLATSAAIDK
ncbi:hypothetical protein E4U42_005032 [Claviceps africana]|uniref:Uncharacterized protein n=1 Tax=Claviceps africana TaxID=83212 RepID=A0A8K0NHM6_9HYPO|nr:hypothetical protein E4U42_005032 [Claviceps africana]